MDSALKESLIAAHKNWLLQFKLLVNDGHTVGTVNRQHIDSHRACELGQLFKAKKVIFEHPLIADIANDIHATFHGISALILDLHDNNAPAGEITEYIEELERVSVQLISLIRKARSH